MKVKITKLCILAVLLVLCGVAYAQGDPTKPFYGVNPILISSILGIIGPWINSLVNKSSYPDYRKRWVLVIIAFIATVGTGIYAHALTWAGLQPEVIYQTFCSFFTVATLTYQSLSGHFSNVTAKVGLKDKGPLPS